MHCSQDHCYKVAMTTSKRETTSSSPLLLHRERERGFEIYILSDKRKKKRSDPSGEKHSATTTKQQPTLLFRCVLLLQRWYIRESEREEALSGWAFSLPSVLSIGYHLASWLPPSNKK